MNYQIRAVCLNKIDEESVDASIDSSRREKSSSQSVHSFRSEPPSPGDVYGTPKNDLISRNRESDNLQGLSDSRDGQKQQSPLRRTDSRDSHANHVHVRIKDADFCYEDKKLIFKPKADKLIIKESKDIIKKINKLQKDANFKEIMKKDYDSDSDEQVKAKAKNAARHDSVLNPNPQKSPLVAQTPNVNYTALIDSLLHKLDKMEQSQTRLFDGTMARLDEVEKKIEQRTRLRMRLLEDKKE